MADNEIAVRLLRLERAEQARTSLAGYLRAVDSRDIDALSAHFAPEVEFCGADGIVRHGRDDVVSFFAALFEASTARPRHFLTNIDVDASDPQRIAVRSEFLLLVPADTAVVRAGTYCDELTPWRDGLRCTRKRVALDPET